MTAPWSLHVLGDGTDDANVWLAGGPRKAEDMLACMVRLFGELKPTMVWIVEAVLGAGWGVLVTFQILQSDLCEYRAFQHGTKPLGRREGHEARWQRYQTYLELFLSSAC